MRKICLALVLFLLLSLPVFNVSVVLGKGEQCFEYIIGSASSYTSLGDFKEGKKFVGTLAAYDSDDILHIGISIWAKPYFAWGEKDGDGDGIVEPDELHSDGIRLSVFGITYDWWVDGDKIRNPAVHVPSYPEGINSERIVYLLNVEIPDDYTSGGTVKICVDGVHVSPKEFIPSFVVPEFPMGTFGAVSVLLLALGISARSKRKTLSLRG